MSANITVSLKIKVDEARLKAGLRDPASLASDLLREGEVTIHSQKPQRNDRNDDLMGEVADLLIVELEVRG